MLAPSGEDHSHEKQCRGLGGVRRQPSTAGPPRGKEPPAPHAHAFSVSLCRDTLLLPYGTVPERVRLPRPVGARRGRSGLGRGGATVSPAPRFRRRRAGCRPVAKRSRTVRGDVRPVARQIEYCRQSSRVARVAWPRGDAVAGAAGRAAVRAAPAAGRCPMSRGPDGVGVGRDATHGPRPRHRTTRANRPRQHDPIGSTDRSVPFDAFEFFFNFI